MSEHLLQALASLARLLAHSEVPLKPLVLAASPRLKSRRPRGLKLRHLPWLRRIIVANLTDLTGMFYKCFIVPSYAGPDTIDIIL